MAITLREGLGRKLTISEMDENFVFLSGSYVVNSITGSMTAASSSVAARSTTLSANATASFADLASDARTATSASISTLASTLSATATSSFSNISTLSRGGSGSFSGSFEGDGAGLTGVAPLAGTGVTVVGTTVSIGQSVATTSNVVFGTVTADTGTFVYQYFESSSTIITSGSNIFGNDSADIQQITGSLKQSGSFILSGSLLQSHGTISGSFQGDGSNLTGISTAPFPFSGSALITGSLNVTGSAFVTSLTETSAKRYKKSIQSLEAQLGNISKLRPVHFEWRDSNKGDLGLIAEEVQKIYPELVSIGIDGKAEGISYTKLTSVLIKAVQELTFRIEELENK